MLQNGYSFSILNTYHFKWCVLKGIKAPVIFMSWTPKTKNLTEEFSVFKTKRELEGYLATETKKYILTEAGLKIWILDLEWSYKNKEL